MTLSVSLHRMAPSGCSVAAVSTPGWRILRTFTPSNIRSSRPCVCPMLMASYTNSISAACCSATSFHWTRSNWLPAANCAGFHFQLLGDPQSDPFELLGVLVQKVKRALAVRHVVERSGHLEVAGTTVRGRIEWDGSENGRLPCVVIDGRRIDWTDFGAMLMAFEGWQFRIELVDPSDEA